MDNLLKHKWLSIARVLKNIEYSWFSVNSLPSRRMYISTLRYSVSKTRILIMFYTYEINNETVMYTFVRAYVYIIHSTVSATTEREGIHTHKVRVVACCNWDSVCDKRHCKSTVCFDAKNLYETRDVSYWLLCLLW